PAAGRSGGDAARTAVRARPVRPEQLPGSTVSRSRGLAAVGAAESTAGTGATANACGLGKNHKPPRIDPGAAQAAGRLAGNRAERVAHVLDLPALELPTGLSRTGVEY